MSIELIKRIGGSDYLLQPLTDLDITKILTLVDPRMNEKQATRFAKDHFSSDAGELRERLAVIAELKTLTTAGDLQRAIDRLKILETEQESLKVTPSRFGDTLYRWRIVAAYVRAVRTWNDLLSGKPSGETDTSPRLRELRSFFKQLAEDELIAACDRALQELDETLPLPRYIHLGLNLREDGYPTELGIISAEGHLDLRADDDAASSPDAGAGDAPAPLNALLNATDPMSPSLSVGPEFVYHRGLYGSHFDEYLERQMEHEWKNRIGKAIKILDKIRITRIPELLSFVDAMSFYQVGLLCAEAFETRGYHLCRPDSRENVSLDIRGALYPDLILRSRDIQGNDLLLKKGNAVIITGPNHSGKTSYLKTIGQCYMLAQLGFFVPADSMVFEPVTNIFTLFSAGEDSSMTASRMGVEVKKLTEILKKATAADLVLLNEPMTSTNPVEAVSICADLTRHFLDVGATHLLVTHLYDIYYLLKAQLKSEHLGRLESLITQSHYDEAAGSMVHSYRLIAHEPLGNSYARETAAAYGITLEAMISDETLRREADRYCDTYNKDSVYEGDDADGLSDHN
ncbi:MAG: hypothetical protein HUJ69_07260 [Lachnospiraceae bacterium]|nr:hypothetical protein [Lachnospiraceae bacterium]